MQASSLIISIFGDAILPRGGKIWLGSLLQLTEPLNLNERLVRTSVFRLVKEDWLQTETVGRRADYSITLSGKRRFAEASRQIYAADALVWDKNWRLILVVGDVDIKLRERIKRALFWQGFGRLGSDCFVHPSADLAKVLDTLVSEGLAEALPHLMPMQAADSRSGLAATGVDLVQCAWRLDTLADAYSSFVSTYLPILAELRRHGQTEIMPSDAFLLRILLIHDYRRLLLRDPELPQVLLPHDWSGQMARLVSRDIYRYLLAPSEEHLNAIVQLADGTCTSANSSLRERFNANE